MGGCKLIGIVAEEVLEQTREQTSGGGVVVVCKLNNITHDGKAFPCTGLTVREDTTVIALGLREGLLQD